VVTANVTTVTHKLRLAHTQVRLPEYIHSPFEVHQTASREIINKANGNYAGLPFASKLFSSKAFKLFLRWQVS
jgi:hypothetical protein